MNKVTITKGDPATDFWLRGHLTRWPDYTFTAKVFDVGSEYGIEGVSVTDKGATHEGVLCYGAIGVGETKMKIHKAAGARLFESNDQVMDAEEVYELSGEL